ncbi:MAG: MotA/TolQ/ExbB proton channel family protein [Bacteroidetes bacterium]|nr:MotA/TolQ/ExbB proton channel family protein [Bacteroidota bacterium]
MISTLSGYLLFAISFYVLAIIGGDHEQVEILQHMFVPEILRMYIHVPGFIFCVIGPFASLLISFNAKQILKSLKTLYFVFFGSKIDFTVYIDAIRDIAQYTQTHDIESLEEYANQIKYPFMRDGVLLLVNGYSKEDIRDTLDSRIQNENARDQQDVDFFKEAEGFAPGYGMLGTTVGLIQMFSAEINPAKGFQPILNAMAVAFTTTLYGLLFLNFVYGPFHDRVRKRTDEEVMLKGMIVEGLTLIRDKKHPIFIQDKLISYVPGSRMLSIPKMEQVPAG